MKGPVRIDKVIKMDDFEIIKFQLITYSFVKDIYLNKSELSILTLLAMSGEVRLMDFCKIAAEKGYYSNATAVNNCLSRIEKSKLFLKKGSGKKYIYLNPEIPLYKEGPVLLNYKIHNIEAEQQS